MERIDVFAHVLPERFYARMLEVEPSIPQVYAFFNNPTLTNMEVRRSHWDGSTKQVISFVNALPEDYLGPDEAAALCWEGNEELISLVRDNRDMFEAGVAMVPMNNIDEAVRIVREQVVPDPDFVGIQIFTRALGKSIADEAFRPLFAALAEAGVPAWLHPVFDARKPDNNIVFSWEYELTQAMLQMVQANIMRDYPELKVICHHAGAMVPFFAGRVERILPAEQAADFKRFYVDTAILGNTAALELAVDYYGADHVLFGTDAPLGILPAGATAEISAAIEAMDVCDESKQAIFSANYRNLVKEKVMDMSTLQTRLFRLERDLAEQERFDKVGEDNLLNSVAHEDGTLAMYATHLGDDPSTCYVFEVYASEDAYQVHAASPQFKAYVNMASTVLTGREVIPVRPELMLEKPEPLKVAGANEVAPRLARIMVPAKNDAAFREAVFANMRASVEKEEGVLVMYAATLADDPTRWVFWEVYASEAAYEAHRATEHFKAYIAATADLVAEKELVPLVADTLASKGVLR